MYKETVYFKKAGKINTDACARAAAERAKELGISRIVVATASGYTALAVCKALAEAGHKADVVGVGYAANYAKKWGTFEKKFTEPAKKAGAVFITGTHVFGGIESAVTEQFGGLPPGKLAAQVLYLFGQGCKVAAEITLMAADQSAVPTDEEIIAIGGTSEGADTALVLTPVTSSDFFKMKIHEIICKPR